MEKDIIEKLKERTVCCGCHKLLFEPYVINCGHTLCHNCHQLIECPVCQAVIEYYPSHPSIDIEYLIQILYPKEYDEYVCKRNKRNKPL